MTAPTTPSKGGTFFTRKAGPLPMWVWMALVLLVAVVYAVWQHNKQAATSTAATSSGSGVPDQTPPTIFQLFDSTNVFTPPSGGREHPAPGPPGPTGPPGPPGPVGPHDPSPPTPLPKPPGPPPPTPVPAPAGQWVTVGKWTAKNAPWNSTLWGIAAQLLGNGANWGRIWNDPQNAGLKSRRKDPKLIQPGDRFWVPK